MSSFIKSCLLFGTFFASSAIASPLVEPVSSLVAIRTSENELAKRAFIPAFTIGSFSVASSFINQDIFKGTISTNDVSGSFEVKCIDCYTKGTALITTSSVTTDNSLLDDIEHPIDSIVNAFGVDVKIELENFEGYFDMEIIASEKTSYSIQLLAIPTPAGVALSGDLSLGLVVYIDLVFTLDAEIDMEAGFTVSFPDGAYIIVDPLTGDIVDKSFANPQMAHTPITVNSGSATFTAALQVRVEAGVTIDLGILEYYFELGLFVDVIEYSATLTSTPACELLITEFVEVNIGAFADVVAVIDYSTFGISPTAVTPIWTAALPSICITRQATTTAQPTTSLLPSSPISILVSSTILTNQPTTLTTSSSAATSTGGIFVQSAATSSSSSTSTILSSYPSVTAWSNSTATTTPMTTSTVYTTDLITVTSCSSTVLHCPASLTSVQTITSITILYTTVCPVGQVQPAYTPITNSVSAKSTTVSMVSVVLSSCATPVVSTIYTPTFATPTYAIQTLTGHAPAFPLWNATGVYTTVFVGPSSAPVVIGLAAPTTTYVAIGASASAVAGVVSSSMATSVGTVGIAIVTGSVSGGSGNVTNGVKVVATATPTAVIFTAGVGKVSVAGSFVKAMVIGVLGLALL
ncbi:hypothetical protein G7Y89_g15628 [Cudoniella acicularis]|uniref:Uncharacterized protein n=1 Tax=Cudoniella acicularis TaxID=354080 RepID=A0A8H4VKK8_9HELO|nr:hypothetical protein G7Y89_g15628 [Cudoniella acicularis]